MSKIAGELDLLKKEIRILGLSAPPRASRNSEAIPVVGVVFRGSLWLDGVISCLVQPRRRDYLKVLVRSIKGSKQYSQIRAVIFSKEQLFNGKKIDIGVLARKINRPAISLLASGRNVRTRRDSMKALKTPVFKVRIHGKPMWVRCAGISENETRQILAVGSAGEERVPEAVRVAYLIAKQLSKSNFLVKKPSKA